MIPINQRQLHKGPINICDGTESCSDCWLDILPLHECILATSFDLFDLGQEKIHTVLRSHLFLFLSCCLFRKFVKPCKNIWLLKNIWELKKIKSLLHIKILSCLSNIEWCYFAEIIKDSGFHFLWIYLIFISSTYAPCPVLRGSFSAAGSSPFATALLGWS